MDLTITELTPDKMQDLDAIARSKGKSVEEYVRELIETEILASKSFDEILTPFRREVKESGMTDDELDQLFRQARKDYAREQRTKD